ncbi:MAG: protein kinase [Myxococcales bacterium]|nr:protein kinase [Myxococcales bacterium]
MPNAGAVVAGKYRIEGLLGRGAMGVVYAASHVVTGAPVALKWLSSEHHDTESRARLYREARAAGRVVHPNVVKVHDVGQHEDAVFLVMERLVGRSLGDAMEAREPLTPADAVRLLMPAFRAVAAAHAAGVIHRDLKPDNLFLAEDGAGHTTLKVLDFGISKLEGGPPELALTQTGVVLGTPLYMAPEQLRGVKDLDGRCDQYALACILYELVEGIAPHEGDNYAELAASKLKSAPRPFEARVPPPFARAVLKALATSPKDRFGDLASFAGALEPITEGVRFSDDADVSGLFPSASPEAMHGPLLDATTTLQQSTIRRRPRWLLPASIAAVLVVGAALGWMLRPEPASSTGTASQLSPLSSTPVVTSPVVEEESPVAAAPDEAPLPSEALAAPVDDSVGDDSEPDAADDPEVDDEGAPARSTGNARRRRHRTGGLSLGDF